MSDDDWAGRTIFVLAIALAIAFLIGLLAVVVSPAPFHGDTGRAVSAGFGALFGIVSTWLYKNHKGK
jgi:hypothetical protein